MDFLDPRKRRKHKIRLIIGYALTAVAIVLAAVVLYFGATGLGIDTKTGEIIQNGLLFVDSHPGGAEIYLNNKNINAATASRLVLPAGSYDLAIKKAGYRDWSRKFVLDQSSVARFVYPFLFPAKPFTATLKSYTSTPAIFTQSLDRHWLLVEEPSITPGGVVFDEYDANNWVQPPTALTLPAGLLTDAAPSDTLKTVEWSSDNNHLLLQHDYSGGTEFIVFSRTDPTTSVNLNKLFDINPTQVVLRDKKPDQFYLYDQKSQTLAPASLGSAKVAAPVLRHVLAFKSYGANTISYMTASNMPAGKVQARFWNGNKSYALGVVNAGSTYLLDIAQFQSHTYYVAGSNTTNMTLIYQDPLSGIQDPSVGRAVPLFALRNPGSNKVSFSANARFVAVQSGSNFATYDFEQKDGYQYSLKGQIAAPLLWMDGHRMIGSVDGSAFVTDYDGTNQQTISATATVEGALFNRDYFQMFTLVPSTNGSVKLQRLDMRAGVDLPKNPNQP
jgi:hypothetical protein